jgi:DNA-binding transcriptional MerR regulator
LGKSPTAFRTISEVAGEIDVPKHVLRFWESKFIQLKPMKRGGGRRYYRPEDVDLLRGIRELLYQQGYTIKGVQRILREEGVTFVKECWRIGGVVETVAPAIPDVAAEAAAMARSAKNVLAKTSVSAKNERAASPASPASKLRDDDEALLAASGRGVKPDGAPLSDEERQKLLSALHELETCRAMLFAALDKTESADSQVFGR